VPYAMVPPGYRAVLLGQADAIQSLGAFAPLEEGSAEGSLFLVRLDFAAFPAAEALSQLEQAFAGAGVEMWPGYDHCVYAVQDAPALYIAWRKGFAWLPIIAGLLGLVVLPPLLGGLVWWLLPQSLKDLISGLINLGMMVVVMLIMVQVMKPLTSLEKPRKTTRTKALVEAGA